MFVFKTSYLGRNSIFLCHNMPFLYQFQVLIKYNSIFDQYFCLKWGYFWSSHVIVFCMSRFCSAIWTRVKFTQFSVLAWSCLCRATTNGVSRWSQTSGAIFGLTSVILMRTTIINFRFMLSLKIGCHKEVSH